jgi:hypothetical protein
MSRSRQRSTRNDPEAAALSSLDMTASRANGVASALAFLTRGGRGDRKTQSGVRLNFALINVVNEIAMTRTHKHSVFELWK